MTMTANLHPITIIILGAIGGMATGLIIAVHWTRSMGQLLRTELQRAAQQSEAEGMRFKELHFTTSIKTDDEAPDVDITNSVKWTSDEISAAVVERWLERRNLIAMPRGKDFKPTAKSGNA